MTDLGPEIESEAMLGVEVQRLLFTALYSLSPAVICLQ